LLFSFAARSQSAKLCALRKDVLSAGQMQRRQFIALLSGTAVALPLAVHAEQPAMPVIGFLCSGSAEAFAPLVAAFRGGLKGAGYVEGRNIAIEFAWAAGQYDKLPSLAADRVNRRVTVIAAVGGAVTGLAAKAATSTIPIVVATGDDPVKYGLASLTASQIMTAHRPGFGLCSTDIYVAG